MSLTVMDDIHVNRGSYSSSPHQAAQSLRVVHFLSIEADDSVMRLYPSFGGRTLGHHPLDEDTRRLGGALYL
jgi:hypothetical protein